MRHRDVPLADRELHRREDRPPHRPGPPRLRAGGAGHGLIVSLRDTALGGAVARAGRSLTHRPALRRAYETLVAAEIAAATACG